jgi:phosphoglycolate phosphatase-like HAD superfamily hydrolase
MRHLVLFDIDGTLVSGGPAKDAFHLALLEVFGTAGDIDAHDFSGKTDPQIARELLSGAGLDSHEVDRGLPALFGAYLRELEARLPDDPVTVLPGVRPLLTRLAHLGDVALGLVTGNIAGGADLKLGSARLRTPFRVGSFGSDREVRNDLPPVAMQRARDEWSVEFGADRTWIVGDTPRDVDCARAHGLRTLAVATGRFGSDDLRAAGAERVLDSLEDTTAVLEILTAP